jgi:hypothetical protein
MPVNGAGNQLLARSGFAGNQNAGVGASDLGYARKHGLQDGRSSDDLLEHRCLIDFFAQRNVLVLELILQSLNFFERLRKCRFAPFASTASRSSGK